MPDPFDDAKRSLDDAAPASDLWAEASRRAAPGTTVPLADVPDPSRWGRWLAAAAVIVLVAGAVAVVATSDEDQSVDTTPATEGTTTTSPPVTTFEAGGCTFGISDEPIPVFTTDPADAGAAHTQLGEQDAVVQAPPPFVRDFVGERVEEVELRRGTAQLWLANDFVQVRWTQDGDAPCDSFSVSVSGGTEDGNRHAAVDLAERIVLPSELAAVGQRDTDIAGEWQLERSSIDGVPTEGDGLTFSFIDGQATWTDGCNSFGGTYTAISSTAFHLGEVNGTKLPCPINPTAEAVQVVMGAEQIDVTFDGDLLVLTAADHVLTLRPRVPEADPIDAGQGFAIWPETVLADVPLDVAQRRLGSLTGILFAREVLGWEDAEVVEAQSEPSEDGRDGGEVHEISSPSRQASVVVHVAPARPDDSSEPFVFVVYQVDTPTRLADPDSTASVQVLDGVARGGAAPAPAGTIRTRVRFAYGATMVEGTPDESFEVPSESTPGSILVIWEGPGGVIGAWGTTLPQGDFAAG